MAGMGGETSDMAKRKIAEMMMQEDRGKEESNKGSAAMMGNQMHQEDVGKEVSNKRESMDEIKRRIANTASKDGLVVEKKTEIEAKPAEMATAPESSDWQDDEDEAFEAHRKMTQRSKAAAMSKPGAIRGDGGYIYAKGGDGSVTILFDPTGRASGRKLTKGRAFDAIMKEIGGGHSEPDGDESDAGMSESPGESSAPPVAMERKEIDDLADRLGESDGDDVDEGILARIVNSPGAESLSKALNGYRKLANAIEKKATMRPKMPSREI